MVELSTLLASIALNDSILAAILAAQVAQLGFEARLLQKIARLEVKYQSLDEEVSDVEAASYPSTDD